MRLFHIYQKPDGTAIRMLPHNGNYLIEEAEVLRQVLTNLGFNPERLALPIHQSGESKIQWYSQFTDLKSFEDFDEAEQRQLTRSFNDLKTKILESVSNRNYREKFEIILSNDLSGEEDAYAPWIWSNGQEFTIIWGAFRAKDEVTEISVESIEQASPDPPSPDEPTSTIVRGCTDPLAANYNPQAREDDGSCEYSSPEPPTKRGCTDPQALNYDPEANEDDGSCFYASPPSPEIFGCTNPRALNYNPEATEDDGLCIYEVEEEVVLKGKSWPHWFWFWLILTLLLLFVILFIGCPDCKQVYSPITGDRIYNPAPGILPDRPNEMLPIDDEDHFSEQMPNLLLNRLNIYPRQEGTDMTAFVAEVLASCPDSTMIVTHWDPLTKRIQIAFDDITYPNMKDTMKSTLASYNPLIWNESLFQNGSVSDPFFTDNDKGWYFKAINFSEEYLKLGDPSIKIAIVDDGFDTQHEDYAAFSEGEYNFCNGIDRVYAVDRGIGQQGVRLGNCHGTHVSGICIAEPNNDKGALGLSPNCTLLPIQISDEWNDMFPSSRIIDGVLYAMNQGANVINLSLGSLMAKEEWEMMSDEEKQAYFEFTKDEAEFWNELYLIGESRGVVFVKAAGNSGLPMHTDSMNRSPIPIYVLASKKDGQLTAFTNYSDTSGSSENIKMCCIAAPGENIVSTFPSNNYEALSGTSMSAPMVSSLVALMLSKKKGLQPKEIRSIIQNKRKNSFGVLGEYPILNFNILLEMSDINS